MRTKLKNLHPLIALFVGIAAYIVLSYFLTRSIINWRLSLSFPPENAFLLFFFHVLDVFSNSYTSLTWCVGFPMCLLSFACAFFLSKRERNGERLALRYLGVIIGIFCLMEGWYFVTIGNFPAPFPVYGSFWGMPVLYSSALLSPVAIVVGNGGFKRHRVLYTCPQCGLAVRAVRNARITCTDCGVPFEPAGRKTGQASAPAEAGQASAPFA